MDSKEQKQQVSTKNSYQLWVSSEACWVHIYLSQPGLTRVFVHSGCHSKMQQARWLTKTNIHSSEFWRLAVWDQVTSWLSVWWEPAFWRASAPVPSCSDRHKGAPRASFVRTVIPSQRLHPHDPITSQRRHLLTPSHLGLGFNMWIYEDTDIWWLTTHGMIPILQIWKLCFTGISNSVQRDTFN